MMFRSDTRALLMIFMIFLMSTPLPLRAEQQSPDACVAEVDRELAQEQRIYRGVLFGHTKAEKARPGDTRYDTKGNAWIKLRDDGRMVWRSPAPNFKNMIWEDGRMNDWDEAEPRTGIFETKKALTSELIPPLTQSMRALRCRLAAVCEASVSKEETIMVQTPGCMELPVDPMPSCQFGDTAKAGQVGIMRGYCRQVADRLLDQESELLKLAVTYDASYRSTVQFAGNFDLFLKEFRVSLLTPIRQAVSLLGQLNRIPCFTSQCDE